ncbi:Uncharacterised protein [Bordetella pertussis]|nr:Uncharacterised protein [Bordetella pertussis]
MRISWCSRALHSSARPPCTVSPIRPPSARLIGSTSTRSPAFQPCTPGPTSTISPATSSPMMTGKSSLMPGIPRRVNTS